jgi:hypothetical protein
MTTPVRDLTRPLLAFWVGDYDMYAAEDEAQALVLANAIAHGAPYTLDDVTPVSSDTLDESVLDGDCRVTSMRAVLLATSEAGYLAGYEQ